MWCTNVFVPNWTHDCDLAAQRLISLTAVAEFEDTTQYVCRSMCFSSPFQLLNWRQSRRCLCKTDRASMCLRCFCCYWICFAADLCCNASFPSISSLLSPIIQSCSAWASALQRFSSSCWSQGPQTWTITVSLFPLSHDSNHYISPCCAPWKYPKNTQYHVFRCTDSELVCLRVFSAVRLALSAVIGVVGGVLLVMSWWRFGSVMACIIVVGLMLGFLIASTVMFTPLGMSF